MRPSAAPCQHTYMHSMILKVLPRSFNDDPLESTEEGCIGSCPKHTSLGLADMGIKPLTSCMGGRNTYHYSTIVL